MGDSRGNATQSVQNMAGQKKISRNGQPFEKTIAVAKMSRTFPK